LEDKAKRGPTIGVEGSFAVVVRAIETGPGTDSMMEARHYKRRRLSHA